MADVHVKRGYVSAVRFNGFQMAWIDAETYDPSITDAALLDWGLTDSLVILTNDAYFVDIAKSIDQAGIVIARTPLSTVRFH